MNTFPEPRQFPDGARIIDGVWVQVLADKARCAGRRALFLDRDGVVCEEVSYLHRIEDVALSPGAADIITAANAAGVPVVLVTNQAGIGYGKFGWDEFVAVQGELLAQLAEQNATIDGVFACPFHEKGEPPFNVANHPARKPAPGMMVLAAEHLGVDLAGSWIIGDKAIDLEAGKRAGLLGGTHVLTGHGADPGERDAAMAVAADGFEVHAEASITTCQTAVMKLA